MYQGKYEESLEYQTNDDSEVGTVGSIPVETN